MLINYLAVAVGAAFGVSSRVFVSNRIKRKWTFTFPMATFVVNMSGSLILGFLAGLNVATSLSLLLGTGFLGAYTTFSTFNLETIELLRRKHRKTVLLYSCGSYVLAIIAILAGWMTGAFLRT